ncbi:YihY/virulence factor BrkB family protein [Oceanobacillus alkalisoli]|uniref:YihY/virulence factor BrkB family protein n=1 Tax=Oceanobacillus alkalisoli TaxID=2925113 RepID=UPI001EE4D59C|nr:YihY/virulence factor BrkB family protein [Oceanobacillus alkalisoli]MCG5104970.1 YihY/virulence factor BrkB family protein [Oceanobacillus alkalisoli]
MKNLFPALNEFYERMDKVDVFGLAAQLAYFFLLSLFPFLLFLFNLIGYFSLDEAVILQTIVDYAPPQVYDLIESNIESLLRIQSGGLLSIGIIGTLWAASNGVNAVRKALNRAYGIKPKRLFIIYRLLSMLLTVGMFFVVIVALLLPVFGKMIGEYFFSWFGFSAEFLQIWETFRWVTSSIIFFIVLVALYRLTPNRRVYFKHIVWGALFSTVGFQLVSWAFSFYVENLANYSTTYGSLGTVIVLMVWFYLFGMIVLIGGVLNASLHERAAWKKTIE